MEKTMAYVRLASEDDAAYLAPRLRKEDLDEIRANSGRDPLEALLYGVQVSTPAYTIIHDNNPVAIFGAGPLPFPNLGFIWMLGSPELMKCQIPFLRQSKRWIEQMHTDVAPMLCNVVDARNEVHIKWLKWCGFTFIKRHEEFGVERRPFLEFARSFQCV
jgi:hypothetical protein